MTATDLHFLAHAIAGVISFLFSVATTVVGAMLRGRINWGRKMANLVKLHRKFSTYLTIIVLGAFFSGLWAKISHSELLFWQTVTPLATVVQGWFGLVVTIMAVAQFIPCSIGKRKNRELHMILGYALLIALGVQIFLGAEATLVEISGG